MTPQDVSDLKATDKMRELFQQKYDPAQAVCYGMGDEAKKVKASSASKNIVVFSGDAWRLISGRHLEHRMKSVILAELIPEIVIPERKFWSYTSR